MKKNMLGYLLFVFICSLYTIAPILLVLTACDRLLNSLYNSLLDINLILTFTFTTSKGIVFLTSHVVSWIGMKTYLRNDSYRRQQIL